jgi:peptidoglycan/xylan/chitin deacetylase (PgdA/CDA1 family)
MWTPLERLLKELFFASLYLSGRDKRLSKRVYDRDQVVVLNLHRVSPRSNPFWSPLYPRLFDDLLSYLKRRFHVSTFRTLPERDRSKPTAILSFDDGYYDFVEYAMPLLDKHGLRANLNVCPTAVTGGLIWEIRLKDFLNQAPSRLTREIRLPGFRHRLGSDDKSKNRYYLALSRFLKCQPREERLHLWERLAAVMARAGRLEATRMMNAAEVRQAGATHEIGAHSFSHESMGLASNAFFEEDLKRCSAFFREQLRLPMDIYAFPNGSYQTGQVEILFRHGVEHVLLGGEQYASTRQRVYPRFILHGESSLEIRQRAVGFQPSPLLSRVVSFWKRALSGRSGSGVGPSPALVGEQLSLIKPPLPPLPNDTWIIQRPDALAFAESEAPFEPFRWRPGKSEPRSG